MGAPSASHLGTGDHGPKADRSRPRSVPVNASAVLNGLPSRSSQRSYHHAICEFIDWYCSERRLAFNKTVVTLPDQPRAGPICFRRYQPAACRHSPTRQRSRGAGLLSPDRRSRGTQSLLLQISLPLQNKPSSRIFALCFFLALTFPSGRRVWGCRNALPTPRES
jgi:hypothetical protein